MSIRGQTRKPSDRPLPKRFIPLSHQSRTKTTRTHNFPNINFHENNRRAGMLPNQGMRRSYINQVDNKINDQFIRNDRIKKSIL